MKHLTLMFSIFVFPPLDQFQFTPSHELDRSRGATPTAEPREVESAI